MLSEIVVMFVAVASGVHGVVHDVVVEVKGLFIATLLFTWTVACCCCWNDGEDVAFCELDALELFIDAIMDCMLALAVTDFRLIEQLMLKIVWIYRKNIY